MAETMPTDELFWMGPSRIMGGGYDWFRDRSGRLLLRRRVVEP